MRQTPRRVVSLSLASLSTDRIARRSASPADLVATFRSENGRLVIAAVNAAATAAGLNPGLPLADARALEPGVQAIAEDAAADRRQLEDLADWCGRYTPWTAPEPEIAAGAAGIWLDMTGAAHLFGGEPALVADLVRRMRGFGFAASAALASTPGAAWALARFDARAAEGLVLEPDAERAALMTLPVACLRLAPHVVTGLEKFGLVRIADLTGLARGPLVARFGEDVARRLDQALGRAGEPVSPRRPVPPIRAHLAFAEPIVTRLAIEAALDRLLPELMRSLEQTRRGLRRLELAFYRIDGAVRRIPIGTMRPVRDAAYVKRLLAEHLDKVDPGEGIELMRALAFETEPMLPRQARLPDLDAAPPKSELTGLVDRLANRLGPDNVLRVKPRASHVPERAQALLPLGEVLRTTPVARPKLPPRPETPPRPPRLLAAPEPIDAMALLPDAPPRQFRWRGETYRIRRAEGPERIAGEWWREDAPTRDYYRVEDESGRRFWLYRDGLYGERQQAPRWYLHGLFA
jgi:protein ImuB